MSTSCLKGTGQTDHSLVILENWAVVDRVISHSYQELQPGKHLTGQRLRPCKSSGQEFYLHLSHRKRR